MKGNNSRSRFTLDMSPGLRTRLKVVAARKSITMRQYCLSAIERQLEREEVGVVSSGSFDREAVEKAKVLQRSVFGKRRLAGESAQLIREARKERASRQ